MRLSILSAGLVACLIVGNAEPPSASALRATADKPSAPRAAADQQPPAPNFELTVDSIMRGPELVGYPPSDLRWSGDSERLYFEWRQPDEDRPETWVVSRGGDGLRQLSEEERRLAPPPEAVWDRRHARALFVDEGDIALVDAVKGTRLDITRTAASEDNPRWARDETHVTFTRDDALFLVPVTGESTGLLVQLMEAAEKEREPRRTKSQEYLKDEESRLLDSVRERARKEKDEEARKKRREPPRLELAERQSVVDAALDGSERYAYVIVSERPEHAKTANVPEYVTESAYTEEIRTRTKVGDTQATRSLAVVDLRTRETRWVEWPVAPPEETRLEAGVAENPGDESDDTRGESESGPVADWQDLHLSEDGQAVAVVRSSDNKERWIVRIDPETGTAHVLDHERDEAWIRRGDTVGWLPDNRHVYFLAEHGGWMHLYLADASAEQPARQALTEGPWEVDQATLSADGARFYLTATEAGPAERHVYTLPAEGGPLARVTEATGRHLLQPSPDGTMAGVLYSAGNKPPEVYLMSLDGAEAATGGSNGAAVNASGDEAAELGMTQVTRSTTDEWRSFPWLDPELITFTARDESEVPARLYTPEMVGAARDPRRPGVIFIHGAGYLQNAHRYWSNYYREYMFHHLLASRGYVVLDIDYRGSAGYGRDWRTAIYRHMGGQDLEDIVDGAKYLVAHEDVDPARLGVYGGSYGGFLTLMAMFTEPDVFAAGAALRPVTDWAHYNHRYTSNILNVPQKDTEAYRRSSPIYFAEGLEGALLICHGMVDTNVHYQDSIRLAQRLIELRKENWELASYPVENHAFDEPTSWADQYRRILKLFEDHLKGDGQDGCQNDGCQNDG